MIKLITGPCGPLYMCIQNPVGPKGKLELGTRVWPYSVLLVHLLNDDVETQCMAREVFENVRNRDISVLKDFLDLLVNKDYQTMYENYK